MSSDPQQPSTMPIGSAGYNPPSPPAAPPGLQRYYYPPPPPPQSGGGTALLGCGLAFSVALNILAGILVVLFCMGIGLLGNSAVTRSGSISDAGTGVSVPETRYSGKT